MEVKKRSSFTLNDKYKIIQDIENGGSQAQICAKLKLSKSTVSNIWKNRHKIKNDWNINASKRKMRPSSYPDVEEMLYKWFLQAKANNIALTGPMLQVKAEEFARLTGKEFKCSNGWLDRFKKRHNIQFGKMCASLSASVVQKWTGQVWPVISREFSEDNIFNATETGVYYKMTPDKTFLFKNEKCRDGKLSKDRITALLCANCSGTEKRKLLIIGKSPNPRCFNNIKSLPVNYVANARSWMTAAIFEDYLKKWDLELVRDGRKVLLVLDKSPAHGLVALQNIELAFLPVNSSLVLQPLHQGVVWSLKQLYRKHVLLRIIEMQENNDEPVVSMLDALNLMHLAWTSVTPRTIRNCFAHCGLVKSPLTSRNPGADAEDIPLSEWLRIMHLMDINEFVEYVNIDNQIHTTQELAEEVTRGAESHESDSEEEEEEEETISSAQALKCTRQLRRYFQTEGGSEETYLQLNQLETTLQNDFLNEYLGFILALNEAIKGKALSVGCNLSENINGVMKLLDRLNALIGEIRPIQQPQRFGNQAFRTWYAVVKDKASEMLQAALPECFHRAVPEILVYFVDGFGNSTRIDYGTGHEISFLMFLCCLFKIGAFVDTDKVAVATRIFPKYLEVSRNLQQTYRMEPAGSHGVWSLDDYQFVPFIWGSAQLIAHPKIEPAAFVNENILAEYAHDYMFLGCIDYINKVKTGPFAEHSNQLWGISGVANWTKVNTGLIKMYKAEVLAKFPVVQHIVFGSLLPFVAAAPRAPNRFNLPSALFTPTPVDSGSNQSETTAADAPSQ